MTVPASCLPLRLALARHCCTHETHMQFLHTRSSLRRALRKQRVQAAASLATAPVCFIFSVSLSHSGPTVAGRPLNAEGRKLSLSHFLSLLRAHPLMPRFCRHHPLPCLHELSSHEPLLALLPNVKSDLILAFAIWTHSTFWIWRVRSVASRFPPVQPPLGAIRSSPSLSTPILIPIPTRGS